MSEMINTEIRSHSTQAVDWNCHSLATFCYRWFDSLNSRFFQGQLPQCLISFNPSRRKEYGHFVHGRNGIGCKYNINITPERVVEGPVELLDTLVHEMVHAFEFKLEDDGLIRILKRKGNYHTAYFIAKMAEIGILCGKRGETISRQDPFIQFLKDNGLSDATKIDFGFKPLGGGSKGKLKKWVCGCSPIYGVRVAIQDFRAQCLKCGTEFKCEQ